ncbi:hypothetical protein GCM10009557_26200 [Virgisporangium ochraceum]|uniref:Uncharacterized protein n=1 Tax=Virgisporangium ochraceum TaxID=65505 RepID=A0A8J4A9J4_9ACTN|nr:hypothetical protein Voc01_104030 [Virgisporangium ochraceum]
MTLARPAQRISQDTNLLVPPDENRTQRLSHPASICGQRLLPSSRQATESGRFSAADAVCVTLPGPFARQLVLLQARGAVPAFRPDP